MLARHTLKQAAKLIGVHFITLYRWEKKAGFPAPKRLARTNERVYTDDDIQRITEWKDRMIDPPTPGVVPTAATGAPGDIADEPIAAQ